MTRNAQGPEQRNVSGLPYGVAGAASGGLGDQG